VQANATNIEIIRGAVDTEKGALTLHVPTQSKGFVSSLKIDDGQPFAVNTITFDEISALVGSSPAALKIDIEGHEYYIIDQAIAFARRHSAPLHIAVHPRFYFADVRRSQGAISARQRTWWATCALVDRLSSLGRPVLSTTGEAFTRWTLMRLMFLRKRIKNFDLEIVPNVVKLSL
jgi:hypothetical protein